VDFEVLCAGIATYLMLGLLWFFAYLLVDRLAPDSFIFMVGSASGHSMMGFTCKQRGDRGQQKNWGEDLTNQQQQPGTTRML
jgi:hypothetical protein